MQNGHSLSRKYDIILWGATGFTGQLVAEYLIKKYGISKDLKLAIAGRDQAKLERLKHKLQIENLPYLVADSHNKGSLDNLTRQTKVICSTVGPYALYGTGLVQSCVENKTHYCDLTGEVQWIRKMIDQFHQQALEAKVKIVHCCGFDSIPSDMGVFFLQNEAQKAHELYCDHIKLRLRVAKGAISGGTYVSLVNVLKEVEENQDVARIIENPYSLNPQGQQIGLDEKDLLQVMYDQDFNQWIGPFIMAMINSKIVRRSHALNGFQYGKDFRYDEAVLTGSGLAGRIFGQTLGTITKLAMNRPNSIPSKMIGKILPKPGQGPSKSERESGFFKFIILGKLKNGEIIKAHIKGDGDPGYGSTSKMLGESAVCLVTDHKILPKTYGVITPSIAMGQSLLTRLQRNAGLSFTLVDTQPLL